MHPNSTAALERMPVRSIDPRNVPAAAKASNTTMSFPCTRRPRSKVHRNDPQQRTSNGIKSRSSRRKFMPATPSVPLTIGSPRHTTAHTMAPRGPIISQNFFTIPTPGNHRPSPSRSAVVGRWFTRQVELLNRRHQSCGSAKLESEFCMRRFSSKLVRNGATALLLESNEVHKRMSNLIVVLKREQHAIRPRYDRTCMLDQSLYLHSSGRKFWRWKGADEKALDGCRFAGHTSPLSGNDLLSMTVRLEVRFKSSAYYHSMTIGEVARRSGLPSSTLRFYEKERLICRPRRVSGRRDYDEEVFANLQLIRMALEGGFTISQARALLHGFSGTSSPSQRWRTLATQKLKEVRVRLSQLQRAEKLLERATRCQCISLTDCADLLLQGEQTTKVI